jgi:hypothetical protein
MKCSLLCSSTVGSRNSNKCVFRLVFLSGSVLRPYSEFSFFIPRPNSSSVNCSFYIRIRLRVERDLMHFIRRSCWLNDSDLS